ncbi:MAG: hypothetical protein ACYDER_20955 [Ktedonobacteraceae bacterium]
MKISQYSIRIAKQALPQLIILCCMLIFIFCIAATVAPLQRLASTPLLSGLSTNGFLEAWGAWLPVDLHLVSNVQTSQISTNNLEFFLLITLAFVMYGISALVIRYQLKEAKNTGIYLLIWVGAIIIGLIFVFTPAMLSHDLFVYADYGHTIAAHGANLYFVPPAAVSHDLITQLDDWKTSIAVYGPLWLYVCSFLALLLGNIPWHYIFGFRLLGLAAHLLNVLLVILILRSAGCTRRTILLGAWLYAMNPLVLLESSFGAHNDILMATFLLLGILLCFRAEQRGFTRPANYILPVVAFTLSALIKFTTLPLIIFFLVLLARKTFYATSTDRATVRQEALPRWLSTCIHVFLAGLMCGLTMLAFYAPFWIGHNLVEIVRSFLSPPSSTNSENSIHRALLEWIKRHGLPPQSSWEYLPMTIFSSHTVWNVISIVVLGCAIVIGAIFLWRIPTTQTLILAGLAALGALLIVTPWFYSWYIIWLIALAGASFSLPDNRMRRALVGFALVFSFIAFLTYISNTIALLGEWAAPVQCVVILGLPLLVLLVLLNVKMTGSSADIARAR